MSSSDQKQLFGESPSLESAEGTSSSGNLGRRAPLAARMRPRNLNELVGQDHILGEDSLLKRLIRTNTFGSILLYGPPGCGKTSLAEVIAKETRSHFVRLNAVLSNVGELRDVLRMARYREGGPTVVFIDEIHRFNKAQQDLLLPDVESGAIRLIGATTHNPGFYVIPPLLSRSHLFRLEPVAPESMVGLLSTALEDEERGLGLHRIKAEEGVLEALARMGDGDLRRALNSLETLVLGMEMGATLDRKSLEVFARERQIRYDANEDEHYDTASALIKSLRGGDPDAALYWMGKMLKGGEDPRFIARRLIIFASEDVGMADSRALPMAVATMQACDFVGLPECRLNLSHCIVFLATCPKSNSTTIALGGVLQSIERKGLQSVPMHLRDAHTALNKSLGQGEGYLYSHNFPEAVSGQDYMEHPEIFYTPGTSGSEARVKERLEHWKKLKAQRKKK